MLSLCTLRGGEIMDSSSDFMSIGGGIVVRSADIELMGVGKVIPDDCRAVLLGSEASLLRLRYVVVGRGVSCIVVAGVGEED